MLVSQSQLCVASSMILGDVQFLVPLLWGLPRDDVHQLLPKLLSLPGDQLRYLYRRLTSAPAGAGQPHFTPNDLLLRLHTMDLGKQGMSMGQLVKALDVAVHAPEVFKQETVARVSVLAHA